jgi:transcriptional regulator with XRE-family HTH domain
MNEASQVTLGELIRRERTRRGDTKQDTAARFGISQASYFRWESGEDRPDDDTFAAIGRYLGRKVDEVWELAHGGDARPDTMEAMRLEIAALWRMVDTQRDALADLKAEVRSVRLPADDRPVSAKGSAAKAPASTAAKAEPKRKKATPKTASSPARKPTRQPG